MLALVLLVLASCHSDGSRATTTMHATLVDANPQRMLVEVLKSGSLSNEMSLSVDPKVKVFAGDKQIRLEQIKPGSPVKVWRDAQTHRVMRVEMEGPAAAAAKE